MKNNKTFFLISIFLFSFLTAKSQMYVGAGLGINEPLSDYKEINKSSVFYILNLENRYYCKLWYGLKIEYSEPEKTADLDTLTPFYRNITNITPNIRYNFLGLNCYENSLFPYLQAGLTISSIGKSDNSSRLGLGFLAGTGINYGFILFKRCFILDANISYNSPNIILRDDLRENIVYIHANLVLNIKL